MRDQIKRHIEQRFAETTIESRPFPHLVIKDFFPADVYEKIQAFNPFNRNVGVEWLTKEQSADVSSRTPYHARKQINFHAGQTFEAPPQQHAFWDEVKELFLDEDWFPNLVKDKYPDFFATRFGGIVDDDDFVQLFRRELFLQRHEPGYYIGPHTDIPTRVFTCIFAFAASEGYEQFGTELLVPKDRMARCWGSDHYGPEGFTVEKVAPYAPNSFLLFFKTRHSFHSVRAIDETVPNQRYGMQFQFYEPHGGLFTDLSTPDLMHIRRANAQSQPESTVRKIARKLAIVR